MEAKGKAAASILWKQLGYFPTSSASQDLEEPAEAFQMVFRSHSTATESRSEARAAAELRKRQTGFRLATEEASQSSDEATSLEHSSGSIISVRSGRYAPKAISGPSPVQCARGSAGDAGTGFLPWIVDELRGRVKGIVVDPPLLEAAASVSRAENVSAEVRAARVRLFCVQTAQGRY